MWSWHAFWLILHIMAAVVAFGPVYTQPMIAALGRRNPEDAVLAAEISETIATRYTIPFAITLPVTGYGLMATEGIGLFDISDITWLWVSVFLYAIALVFALAVQTPNQVRMLRLLRSGPAAPHGEGQGPSPEIPALGRRLGLGGMFLTLMVTAIFVLMIWQPRA